MWMGDWVYPGDKPFQIGDPYSAFGEDKEFRGISGTPVRAVVIED